VHVEQQKIRISQVSLEKKFVPELVDAVFAGDQELMLDTVGGASVSNLVSESEARQLHDAGFELVCRRIYPATTDTQTSMTRLYSIIQFRREQVLWAEICGNSYVSLQNGKNIAWMVIVPPSHRLMDEQDNVFQAHCRDGLNILSIKPVKLTHIWAGIFQVHEAGHLYDIAIGAEGATRSLDEYVEGEVRAYRTEDALVSVITQGKFSTVIDDIIITNAFDDPTDILMVVRSDHQKWEQISLRLGTLITHEFPASVSEMAMRYGYYVTAIAFRIAERQASNDGDLMVKQKKAIVTIMRAEPSAARIIESL